MNSGSANATQPDRSDTAGTFPPLRRPFSEPAAYAEARAQEPISKVRLPDGGEAWLLTKHQDARAVLVDRSFSSDRLHPHYPLVLLAGRPAAAQGKSMVTLDGQEHADARRSVLGEFTANRLKALRPAIQAVVDRCIDDLLASSSRGADLVSMLSLPVPSIVICTMLGVPYEDHDLFQNCSSAMFKDSTSPEDRLKAIQDIRTYLRGLVEHKIVEPGDDLISRQIQARRSAGSIDAQEIVTLCALLLVAGHETTANMISLGSLALMENPEQAALVRNSPDRTPPAVEELLRFFSITDLVAGRVAIRDTEISGVSIRAGEGVIPSTLAANWDETVFESPGKIDFSRSERHHIAFGFGPHQCLGQNLARIELQVVFDTLLRRIPDLRLAVPVDELRFKDDGPVYGLYELPVTW